MDVSDSFPTDMGVLHKFPRQMAFHKAHRGFTKPCREEVLQSPCREGASYTHMHISVFFLYILGASQIPIEKEPCKALGASQSPNREGALQNTFNKGASYTHTYTHFSLFLQMWDASQIP